MIVDTVRRICRKLPAVTEDIKWGNDLCFLIGGKMFCVMNLDTPHTVSFKVTPEEFGELTSLPGIIPAPYMARNMWVQVQEEKKLSAKEWERYLRQSHLLVGERLPKKVQEQLGLKPTAPGKSKKKSSR